MSKRFDTMAKDAFVVNGGVGPSRVGGQKTRWKLSNRGYSHAINEQLIAYGCQLSLGSNFVADRK
jgi:hypothetical protein